MKFLGILDTQQHKIFDITARKSNKKLLTKISTDEDFVAKIQTLTPDNKRSCNLVSAKKHPVSLQLKETMRTFTVKEIVLYNDNCIEVCDTNIILAQILRGRHKIKPSRHPGKSKTLSLTRRSFMWLSMTAYIHRHVSDWGSCQQPKSVTQKPFGALDPLPKTAGPWK